MPPRKKVALLPARVRKQLDRKLVEKAFSGYAELSDWLAAEGYAIGKSALHEYGSALERRIEQLRYATDAAEALRAGAPDDAGAVAEASLRMAQERIFQLMLAAERGDMKEMSSASRALAEVARASISIRRERRQVLSEAAEAADAAAIAAGVSADTAALIRAAIQGQEAP